MSQDREHNSADHRGGSANEEIEAVLQRDLDELIHLADFYSQRNRPDKAMELYNHVKKVREQLNKARPEGAISDENVAS